jgi:hypothetical protein
MSWNVHIAVARRPSAVLGLHGRREKLRTAVHFHYEQSLAEFTGDLLKVVVPVRISAAAGMLEQLLDGQLEAVSALLEGALQGMGVEVVEAWVSDDDDQPITEWKPVQTQAAGEGVTVNAHWLIESPTGFPNDEAWLTHLIRQLLLSQASPT